MYEMIIETAQIQKIKKYKVGTPNTAPSKSNMSTNGIFSNRNTTIPKTTNFCSCRFFKI